MADGVDRETRSRMTSGGKDTRPAPRPSRLRYRLHDRKLRGRPGLAFSGLKAVVRGCFWHGHGCHPFRWPTSRMEFRKEKIPGNRERNNVNLARFGGAGYRFLVVCALEGRLKRGGDEVEGHRRLRSWGGFLELRSDA